MMNKLKKLYGFLKYFRASKRIEHNTFKSNVDNHEMHEQFSLLVPTRCWGAADQVYFDALDSALYSEEPLVRNVAITGSYGSGKSTLLEKYQDYDVERKRIYFEKNNEHEDRERHCSSLSKAVKGKDLSFISVSLASFNYKKSNNRHNSKYNCSSDEDHQSIQEIEIKVLQQLLYQADKEELPQSNIKRIEENESKKSILLNRLSLSVAFVFTSLCVLYGLFPSFIGKRFEILQTTFHMVCMSKVWFRSLWVSIFGFLLLYFLNRFGKEFSTLKLKKYRINKVGLFSSEIGFEKEETNSILNKYIDEILYFFERTKFNVVIFEDLDRLNNDEIFTKLREINHLINQSAQVKKKNKKVIFIYAVRDDLFEEGEERTKFFDFIVPILPVVDSNNSSKFMIKKVEDIEGKLGITEGNLSSVFLKNISLDLSDMRIINNILNEYVIYTEKINIEGHSRQQLFALIVYKNIYPNRFAQLQYAKGEIADLVLDYNEGLIFKFLNEQNELELIPVNEQITNMEMEAILIEEDLRREYLDHLRPSDIELQEIQYINQPNASWQSTGYAKLINDPELFLSFTKSTLIDIYLPNRQSIRVGSFRSLEEKVNSEKSYIERLQIVRNKHMRGQDNLYNIKQNLVSKMAKIRGKSLAECFEEKINVDAYLEFKKLNYGSLDMTELAKVLIQEGYITEFYDDYISMFYPGDLTLTENKFIRLVRSRATFDKTYNLSLSKPKLVYQELQEMGWGKISKREAVLNKDLLEFFLKEDKQNAKVYERNLLELFGNVINGPDMLRPLSLLRESMRRSSWLSLIKVISKDEHFWEKIDRESLVLSPDVSVEKVRKQYIQDIVSVASVNSVKNFINLDVFLEYIVEYKDFLDWFENIDQVRNAQKIIKQLSIRFVQLNVDNETDLEHGFLSFILDNGLYELNNHNIKLSFLEELAGDKLREEDLSKRNYTVIFNSDKDYLKEYIGKNIIDYVNKIVLLPGNNSESEEAILFLLKHKAIESVLKKKILKHMNMNVVDIESIPVDLFDDIEDADIRGLSWDWFLDNKNIQVSWGNIFKYLKKNNNNFTTVLVNYLSNKEIYLKLDYESFNRQEEETQRYLCTYIYGGFELDIAAYRFLIAQISWTMEKIPQTEYVDKVEALINSKSLRFDEMTIKDLKEYYPNNYAQLVCLMIENEWKDFLSLFISGHLVFEIDWNNSADINLINGIPSIRNINDASMAKFLEKLFEIEDVKNNMPDLFSRMATILSSSFKILSSDKLLKYLDSLFRYADNDLVRVKLLNNYIDLICKNNELSVVASLFKDDGYKKIGKSLCKPVIEKNNETEKLVSNLVRLGLVGKIEYIKNKIRINNLKYN